MDNIKEQLEAIRLKNKGLLTEDAILAEAKAKSHPLHGRFTWNNTEAGKLWRMEEARILIRSVYVTIEPPNHAPVMVRAYASLPSDREGQGGYRAIQDILSNDEQRAELLLAALSELDAFKKRYSTFSELAPIFTALKKVKIGRTVVKSIPRKRHGAEARI